MTNRRDQIIDTTCQLMEIQGYHATGLNQILDQSGAPKGSLYYYFPEGKEELAVEAIDRSSSVIVQRIQEVMALTDDPAEAVTAFLTTLAGHVEASSYRQGGPITAIALEAASTNERLRLACRDAYALWQSAFAAKLDQQFGQERAGRLATLIISAIEGAILLSRSERTIRPLLAVAEEIGLLLQSTRPAAEMGVTES